MRLFDDVAQSGTIMAASGTVFNKVLVWDVFAAADPAIPAYALQGHRVPLSLSFILAHTTQQALALSPPHSFAAHTTREWCLVCGGTTLAGRLHRFPMTVLFASGDCPSGLMVACHHQKRT
jgi:hypothetical protein